MKTSPTSMLNAILFVFTCLFGFCQTAICDEQPVKASPEIIADWKMQELKLGQQLFQSADGSVLENAVITQIFADLEDSGDQFQDDLEALQDKPGNDPGWKALFEKACATRREERLLFLHEENAKFVFVKRRNFPGSHYAYTEGLSDANFERHFLPGSQLCLLEFCEDGTTKQTVLLDCPNGVIRDPAVSFKGDYIVFAMKKSCLLDDYHLYKMDVESKEVTQLTFGLGYADYEPCCLPNGEILFNSTRCVQIVDCWYTEVSNIYRVNEDGKYLRRVTVDQVHDNYPTMTDKGLILYTRWDYNDRGQIFPQGLFQMSPDGTGQTAFYGNNSWFPTSILHARGIPNSSKVLCIFSGHHTRQRGKLGVLDPRLGREEATGAQLVAPVRETKAVHVDRYGQDGEQFCYPYPMSENDCLVSYRPNFGLAEGQEQGEQDKFDLYYMDFDGNRELLVQDPTLSCVQAVQLKEQELLFERPSQTDPTLDYSTYYIQNIFLGPGLEGVDKKQVRSLRVINIDFRTNSIGRNGNNGPAGGALSSCPISVGGGAWDPKRILGEAKIYEDGSCWFRVPPMTPVYFQVIDVNGRAIQTMRSWSTLQPGEKFSCIGCHEDKNSTRTNVAGGLTQAMRNGAQDLTPFYGDVCGFSFQKEIQPILNKHCVQCHENDDARPSYMALNIQEWNHEPKTPQELGLKQLTNSEQLWSATIQQPKGDWQKQFPLPSSKNTKLGIGNVPYLESHNAIWDDPQTVHVWTTTELELPADYQPRPLFARILYDDNAEIFINGQRVYLGVGFANKYYTLPMRFNPLKPGKNIIAIHASNPVGGGQGLDVTFWESPVGNTLADDSLKPFSLKDTPAKDPLAKRIWTRSYLNLTNGVLAIKTSEPNVYHARQTAVNNWLNVQEAPPMLKPYHAGSVKSELSLMFDGDNPHNDVQLSQEEKDKLNAWIDLLIPFCGTYEEANMWDEADQAKAKYQMDKRLAADQLNADNFEAWLKSKTPRKHGKKKEFVIADADNPYRAINADIEPKTENGVTTWTFEQPIRTDQIVLPVPATAPIEVQLSNGFKATIPAGKTSIVFAPQECTSVTVKNCDGKASVMGIVK